MFDRVEAKEHARGIMRNDLSACVGAYMLSLLLSVVPFGRAAGEVGLWRYNIDVARGGRPRASKTLRGYDSFSRALALNMWIKLYIFLWSLPGIVLNRIGFILIGGSLLGRLYNYVMDYTADYYYTVMGIGPIYSGSGGGGGYVFGIILVLIAWLWSIFILLYKRSQYMLSYAVLADHPGMTGKQCLDASVEITTPFIGQIIIARLSFIGWLLVSMLTSGIAGLLYVFPYIKLTWADLYCQIVPREQWGSAGGSEDREYLPQGFDSNGSPSQLHSASAYKSSQGAVRGVAGYYTGYKFPLNDGESLGIGRDSKLAQIVFADSEDSKKISRLHCTVTYSAGRGVYTVMDRSSNGTYKADGSQLPPNTPVELPRGTTIYLGGPENSFILD